MNFLEQLKPEKEFFIGIDSDGCVFDTMEVKHKEFFCPNTVKYFGLFAISSFAFPGTNNFVGELYILVGTFAQSKVAGFFSVVGAVLAAAYMLRLLKQITWGRDDKRSIKDMNIREVVYLIPLALFVLWMGLFPAPFVYTSEKTLSHLFNQLQVFFR